MRLPQRRRELLRFGLGAGIVGAGLLALRYALRPAAKAPLPDTLSPAIFATRVFPTSQGQIVYHESGTGDPLIFVHGISLGASSYLWSKIYPRFAASHRVYAPDLVGFGESERPDRALSAADHVRSLAEFIRGVCGGRRPTLVGSDLGAGFCALLATQHPDLIARLLLLMPTGLRELGHNRLPAGISFASRIPGFNGFLYRNYLARRTSVRGWLANHGFADPSRLTEEIVDVYTTCAQQAGADHAILHFLSGSFHFDLEARLPLIPHPTTLLWGGRAAYPPVAWAPRFQELIPHCNLRILDEAGLLAPLEQPDALAALIAEELDGALRVVAAG